MDVRRLIACAGCSRGPCSGPGDLSALGRKVGVLDGLEVAGGALDAEAEEVADAAYVAAGGVDLVQDAVLAQRLGSDAVSFQGKEWPAGDETGCGASVDEQVRVERWPARCGCGGRARRASRVRTGAASGMSRSSMWRRPSTMSVS